MGMDGDGCAATWMYLVPLNCILKNGEDGNCYVHFTTTKKKWKKQKLWYNNAVEYYSAVRNELLIHPTGMNLQGIMLSVKSSSKRFIYHMISFTQHSQNDKIIEAENRLVVPGLWDRTRGEVDRSYCFLVFACLFSLALFCERILHFISWYFILFSYFDFYFSISKFCFLNIFMASF